jgi:hypothetical protein
VTCDDVVSEDDGDGSPPVSFKLPLALAAVGCMLSFVPTYAKTQYPRISECTKQMYKII